MQDILQQILQLLGGVTSTQSSVTVREWLETWYATYKAPYRKTSTLQQLQMRIDRYILPTIGNVNLSALTGMQLQELLNGISADNIRVKVAGILRDSLTRAVKNRLLLFNPFDSVEIPAHHAIHYRPLEFAEQNVVLTNIADRVKLSAMWVLLCTGMRVGEFLALDFTADISTTTNEICIGKSLNVCTGEITTPKTANGVRRIPYTPRLITHIKRLQAYQASGKTFNYAMLRSYFCRLFKRCNIPNANLYSFRHTFISLCHLAEIPAKYVQYWAGHSDINLTLNTYTHILRKGTSPFFEYIKNLKANIL